MRPWYAVAIALFAIACGRSEGDTKGKPAGKQGLVFPVELAPVEVRSVEYLVEAVGSIDAFETVQVTARVAGAVEKVRFREGDVVKEGSVLVEIEPQRYNLALRSARATLARTIASREDAERGYERRKKMAAEGVASREDAETYQTRLATAKAEEAEARAAVSLANLNLRDAYVRAPMNGTIDSRRVQTGQYVQPGTVLATLVRRDPLLLRFRVAEQEAASVDTGMTARFRVRGRQERFEASVTLVSAAADASSRMVEIVAEVRSENEALRPGAFAEVEVPIGAADSAIVPQTAVRPSERGFLAFVAADGVVSERVVTIGRRTDDGMVEVRTGLHAGETVVVRGAEALSDGAKVRVTGSPEPPRASPPASPASAGEADRDQAPAPSAPTERASERK